MKVSLSQIGRLKKHPGPQNDNSFFSYYRVLLDCWLVSVQGRCCILIWFISLRNSVENSPEWLLMACRAALLSRALGAALVIILMSFACHL